MTTNFPLDALSPMTSYRERRQHIFPSDGSLQWFVRSHRLDLITCGAIVRQRRQWYVHEQRFDEFVLIAAMDEAKKYASSRQPPARIS